MGMSNNTTIQQATIPGDTISTEDIGSGIKLPRSKMVLGTSGVDGGDVSAANPMPVTATTLAPGAATSANQTTTNTTLTSANVHLHKISRSTVPSLIQLSREGRFQFTMNGTPPGWSTNTHPTVSANAQVASAGASQQVPMGRAWVIVQGQVGADGLCRTYFQSPGIQQSPASGQVEYVGDAWTLWGVVGQNGGNTTWQHNGGMIAKEYESIQQGVNNPTTTGVFHHAFLSLIDITNDLNFNAQYRICVLSDSIGWTMPGTNGVTSSTTPKANGRDLWPFRITERLRDKGASVRLINKSYGSNLTNSAVIRTINNGWIDIPFDLLFISLGMNDSFNNGTLSSVYQSNLQILITQAKRVNSSCSIIICAPPSTNDPARQWANLVAASSTGTSVTSNTATLPTGSSAVDNFYNGDYVWVTTDANGSGQLATIASYVGSTRVATLTTPWPILPTGTITLAVYNSATNPTYIADIRTKAQAAVTAAGGAASKVYFCDLSTAYGTSASDISTNFGDAAPSVHPNQAGHALLANVVAPVVQTTDFYTNTLGLTGSF